MAVSKIAVGSWHGVIDSPDRFEQVFDQRHILEVSEKISHPTFR